MVVLFVGKCNRSGVLEIDSPSLDRFSAIDQEGIELLCRRFCEMLSAEKGFI